MLSCLVMKSGLVELIWKNCIFCFVTAEALKVFAENCNIIYISSVRWPFIYWRQWFIVCSHWGLTHWGRVTQICFSKLTIIGSDSGLLPGRCQAIIWINARILLIGALGTNFSVILIEIDTFSLTKFHLKMSSGEWRPFCLGLNVLTFIPF